MAQVTDGGQIRKMWWLTSATCLLNGSCNGCMRNLVAQWGMYSSSSHCNVMAPIIDVVDPLGEFDGSHGGNGSQGGCDGLQGEFDGSRG